MTDICNRLVTEMGEIVKCKQIIVSGGIADCLDGYYCTEKLLLPAVFGMASAFLRHAEDLEQLRKFAKALTDSYRTAKAFLRVR
jgi:isopentenyl-diphosphate delta-isomerase